MDNDQRLEQIRRSLAARPDGPTEGITVDEARFLLGVVDAQAARLAELEKKTNVLSRHVMELTEELENVKMDFGGGSPR